MKIGTLTITKKKKKSVNEWIEYLVKREKKFMANKAIKKSDGTFISVPKSKNNFHLAFNEKRFADGSDLKALEKCFPVLFKKIKEAIEGGQV